MQGSALGSTLDTKLQVIELSLLPPNSQGLMPSGIQRFPFEFPIPTSLPTTVYIKDRMEIFYQVRATLCRSSMPKHLQPTQDSKKINSFINWARNSTEKSKYTAVAPMRIVRAMESILKTNTNLIEPEPIASPSPTDQNNRLSTYSNVSALSASPLNRRSLDLCAINLDEQHDSLAFSLAGRSLGNLAQPIQRLAPYEGIRYKIGIDRTAIALGTSIGVEVMVEPTFKDAVVKSIALKVSESRKYSLKSPSGHTLSSIEQRKIVLKWAYDYFAKEDETGILKRHIRPSKSRFSSSNNTECPGSKQPEVSESLKHVDFYESEFSADCDHGSRELVNLKELNQPVSLGEYFGGRFTMLVPDCSNILHPSMEHESITIKHWLQLVVTIECNGKTFDLHLETPGQVLDCRLVNDDEDGNQTLIPPPPAYEPGNNSYKSSIEKSSNFWEQREPITLVSGWGSCVPCPCEAKKLKKNSKCNDMKTSKNINEIQFSSHLPEWGPPPSYSTD